jgi:hypothetical protein
LIGLQQGFAAADMHRPASESADGRKIFAGGFGST